MMASGPPLTSALPFEFYGLLDRGTTGGGGDVDELFHIPPSRLSSVGVDIEAAEHPRRIAGATLRSTREIRVPVRAGRVPNMHVSIHDAGGLVGHQASGTAVAR